MIEQPLLEASVLGLILYVFIKEFFAYLKNKKTNNIEPQILEKISLIESNHLNEICKRMNEGDDKITTAITNMHKDVVQLLGEIKGKLEK